MKYIVYKTTNIINQKIYIGVHQTLNPDKFDGYLGCDTWCNRPSSYLNPKTTFQRAVKKYGPINFKREVLHIFDTSQEAFDKEAELVTQEFVDNPNTYNMVLGGKGGVGEIKGIYQFTTDGKLVKFWENTYDVLKIYNITINAIYTCLQFKETLCGYYWSRNSQINIEEFSKPSVQKKVFKYDKVTGELVTTYDSITSAAKNEELNRSVLTTSIKLESLVKDKYYFSHEFYYKFIKRKRESLRNKIYYIYTLNGNYITSINSSKELMKYLQITHWNCIYRALNVQNGVYKNWQIKLQYEGIKIQPVNTITHSHKIQVMNKQGVILKTCQSIQEVSKEFNLHTSSINRVLRGLQKTTGNYILKLIN